MFLVRPKPGAPPDANERIAVYAVSCGGYVLMATPNGSLVVMMPLDGKRILEANVIVGFVGGVRLNENAPGHKALQGLFLNNVARQLTAGRQPLATASPSRVHRGPGS